MGPVKITELTALEMYNKWLIIIGGAQIFHNEQPVSFSLLILFLNSIHYEVAFLHSCICSLLKSIKTSGHLFLCDLMANIWNSVCVSGDGSSHVEDVVDPWAIEQVCSLWGKLLKKNNSILPVLCRRLKRDG